MGYTTMSGCHLPSKARNRICRDDEGDPCVSQAESKLLGPRTSSILGLVSIEFKSLPKNQPQGSEKLLPGVFLSIDPRHLFDPANPPWSILSNYRGKCCGHCLASPNLQ